MFIAEELRLGSGALGGVVGQKSSMNCWGGSAASSASKNSRTSKGVQ
jgi:hypothetical protein